jgi:hypothetical protein
MLADFYSREQDNNGPKLVLSVNDSEPVKISEKK